MWQAKRHNGFGIKGVSGTFCVADLSTSDQDGASRFYEQLFEWRIGKKDEDPSHNYYHLFNHAEFIGGILPPAFRNPGAPPHLADLFVGLRLRCGSHKGAMPWCETPPAAYED
jgi:hypothetical protein